jgi:uncharacterized protein YqhQ
MEDKAVSYGGQAVIEGVMMRGRTSLSLAMRDPTGKIITHTEELGGIYKSKLVRIPFLRGLILLWDSLGLGIKTLTISANNQTRDKDKIEGPMLYLTLGTTILIAVVIFFLVPAGIGFLSQRFFNVNAWLSNLLEGVIRLLFLIGYIWAIGFMPDIRRVFGYHGAEHKTINAYEAGAELSPKIVSSYSVQHPRCGTAFLLTLVLLSILIFTLIGPLPSLLWRLVSRILLIPVIAGLSYEFIRWTARHSDYRLVRLLTQPNLALQALTTREPDELMLEVAITAFLGMREAEKKADARNPHPE